MKWKDGVGTFPYRLPRYQMIRTLRDTPVTRTPLAAVPGEAAHDDVRILREIVTALSERVEILEAQALLIRPLLVARTQR